MDEIERLHAENRRLTRALLALRNSDNATVAMLQHHAPYTEIVAHVEAGVAAAERAVTVFLSEVS
jgi:hypothetical protein